ncbi:MAG: GDSL-type esterase/lipase family protein [Lachnospiraceae bacterium]|nr:GDSL-type esterase/lipase family protein [Lachnospiraceae bacterium]
MKKPILCKMVVVVLLITLLLPMMKLPVHAAGTANYGVVFQAEYYATMNPDVAAVCGTNEQALLRHFLSYGMKEGRIASPEFHVYAYALRYADLGMAFGMDWEAYYRHYMLCGKAEGRIATLDGQPYEGEVIPVSDVQITTAEQLEAMTAQYLSESMFIGDSIMLGYMNYTMRDTDPCGKGITFHCVGSYSARNALSPVTQKSCHPLYKGQKMNPWTQLTMCPNVKRVFIMLGMNDIGVSGAEGSLANYLQMIANMQAVRPDLEIHIISMTYVKKGADKGALSSAGAAKFNALLQETAMLHGYGYVDMATPLSDGSGHLANAYCSDGFVHISRSGYDVWKNVIHAYVATQLQAQL